MKQKKLLLTFVILLLFSISSLVSAQGVTLSVDDKLSFDEPSLALLKYASFFATDLGKFEDEPLMTLTVNNDYDQPIKGYFEFTFLSGDNEEIGYIRTGELDVIQGENIWEVKAGGVTNVELITDIMDQAEEEGMTEEEFKEKFDLGDIEDWTVDEARGDEDWVKENIFDWTGMDEFTSDDIQKILDLSLPKGSYKLEVVFNYEAPDGSSGSDDYSTTWTITNPEAVSMDSPEDGTDDLVEPEFSWQLPELPEDFEVTSRITIWDNEYGGSTVIEREHTSGYDSLYTTTIESDEYEFLPGRMYQWTVNLIGPGGQAIGGGNDEVWSFAFENTPPTVSLEVTDGELDDLWEGDEVSFTAEFEDEGTPQSDLDVIWSVNGDEEDSGQNFSYTFEEPGDYVVEVEVFDEFDDSTSRQLSFTVQDNLPPEVEIINEDDKTEYVIGEYIRLTGEVSDPEGEITRIEWYMNDAGSSGDGTMVGSGEEFEMRLGKGGEKKITLLVEDNREEINRDTIEINVIENHPPQVSIDSPESGEYMFGEVLELEAEATDDIIEDPEISWEIVGGEQIEGDSFTIPETEGEITFRAWTRDEQGQLGEAFITITAIPNTPPSVNIQSPEPGVSFNLEEAEEMVARASAVDPDVDQEINWSWEVVNSDGQVVAEAETGDTAEFEFGLDEPGLYTLTAIATDSYGDSGQASISFNVIEVEEVEEDLPPLEVEIITPEADSTYYAGEEVNLSGEITNVDSTSGTIYTWVVEGKGSIGTGQEFTYRFSQTGSLTLILMASNERGQTGRTEIQINIEGNNAPEVSIEGAPDPEEGIRQGDEGVLTAETSDEDGHDVSLTWKVNYSAPPAGLVDGNQLDLSALSVGSYTISVVAQDELGARGSAEVSFPVKANQAPVIKFTEMADKVVTGEEINIAFSATDPENDPLEIEVEVLNPDRDIISTETTAGSISFNAEQNGDYSITVRAADSKGASATNTRIVKAVPNKAPVVKIISPKPGITVISGQEFNVELNINDPEGDQIDSLVVNGQTITDYDVVDGNIVFPFTVNQTGAIVLNVSVNDSKGKTGNASVGVVVTSTVQEEVEQNQSPEVSITLPEYGTAGIPFADELTLNASVTDPDNTTEELAINWFINDELVGSGTGLTHTFLQSGELTIKVEAVDINGAKGTATVTATVQENEPPVGSVLQPLPGSELNYQQTVMLEANVSDPDGHQITYTWLLDDNVLGTGNPYQYTFAQPGTHRLTLRATDSYGAGSEYTYNIKVLPPAGETLPPVITDPLDRTVILAGTEIAFMAENLPEEGQVNWRSSLDGVILTPEAVDLSPGEHNIMLLVDGMQVDSVTVFVIEEENTTVEEQPLAAAVAIKGSVKFKHENTVETLNTSNFFQYEFFTGDLLQIEGNNNIEILFYGSGESTVLTANERDGVYRFTEDGIDFIEGETITQ